MSDHADLVARIKADLEARGVSLVGPCGAWAITKRVVWALRGERAGLLSKPGGNNCDGFAVDIVCYPDGTIIDMLANAGGDEDANGNPIPGTGNRPTWSPPSDGKPVDPSRWRAPIDPGDVVAVPDPPPVDPPHVPPGSPAWIGPFVLALAAAGAALSEAAQILADGANTGPE